MTRTPSTTAAPSVATGQTVAVSPASAGRRPGLLGPWLAAGLGLVAVTAVPNDGPTDPAGALGPPRVVAPTVASALDLTGIGATESSSNLALSTLISSNPTTSSVGMLRLGDLVSAEQSSTRQQVRRALGVAASDQGVDTLVDAGVVDTPVWTSRSLGSAVATPADDGGPTDAQWEALRACESGGDYGAINATGKYRGAYQFDMPTWQSVGGVGDPAEATPAEQDERATLLFQRRGASPWPFCGRYLSR